MVEVHIIQVGARGPVDALPLLFCLGQHPVLAAISGKMVKGSVLATFRSEPPSPRKTVDFGTDPQPRSMTIDFP